MFPITTGNWKYEIAPGFFNILKHGFEFEFCILQASFLQKKINLSGRRIQLAIWDTAGQERFHALGPIYYRDANGAILVYDITDQDSFQKVSLVSIQIL